MPIKVRCRGCEKVLNVPDSARGKVIQCPDCQARMRVPGDGDSSVKQAAARPAAKKKVAKQEDTSSSLSGEIFINLNLDEAEHEDEQICPYCAAALDEDDEVCRSCGMNIATGRMDRKEAKKRSRKGPDTNKFWKLAWSDPWSFLWEHKSLPFRTARYWTQFAVLVCLCFYMAHDYCDRGPLITFWSFLTIVTVLGIPGWYWTLSMKLIQAEIFREEIKPDRIHFDFLQNVALGLRAVIWPFVVMLPAWLVLGLVWALDYYDVTTVLSEDALRMAAGVTFGLPFVMFPLATIHMTSKYTYKAWIFYELVVIFARNLVAGIYWLLQAALLMGPIFGIIAALEFAGGGANPFSNTHIDEWSVDFTNWFYTKIGETVQDDSFMFAAVRLPLEMIFALLIIVPIAFMASFPAVFLMRSNALLGYYFHQSLDLVNDIPAGAPAGFWVRFLAFWGDMLVVPLSSFLVLRIKKAVVGAWLIDGVVILTLLTQGTQSYAFQVSLGVFALYNSWLYFAVPESGSIRGTVAKEAFGMVVNTANGKQLSLKQATGRWICSLFSGLTLGIGFVMCAFHPKKKALHDVMSKSEVVWRGEH